MIYKSNKIDPFFPIIKNYDTIFTQSQKTVYLIFSYLYNKNKPRSIFQYTNFFFTSIQSKSPFQIADQITNEVAGIEQATRVKRS